MNPDGRRGTVQGANTLLLIVLVGVLLYFIAIQHINVGVATLLNYTAPIYSGIFSVLFIGERISAKVLLPLPVALSGVYLVVHSHARPGDLLGFGRWELFAVASAICSGLAVTAMRAARIVVTARPLHTAPASAHSSHRPKPRMSPGCACAWTTR